MPMLRTTFRTAAALLALIAANASAQQAIIIEKATNGEDADAPPGPVLTIGDPVAWTYVVTNGSGRTLVDIAVTDDQGVVVSCPATSLAAGESMTCTGSGTVQAGQYANIGTVAAADEVGSMVGDSDPSHYFGQDAPALSLETATEGFDADTPTGPVLAVGSSVNWTYAATNIGTETLSNVQVSDDQGVTVTCPATTLAAGESMTCTASGTVQPGQYANLGSVTAQLPDSSPVAATDPSHHFGQTLLLEKRTNGFDADVPPGPTLAPGSTVTWTYEITNPGPAELTAVAVSDDQGVVVGCPAGTLAAGASMTCSGSGTVVAGQYANIGTATGTLPLGGVVSASDPSHYFGNLVAMEKATNGIDADLPPGPTLVIGDPVDWTYTVTNLAGETLESISVSDDQGVIVSCPGTTLAPGESMACTGSGTVAGGQYANIGTVTGTISAGPLTASDPSHYFGQPPQPAVDASKTDALQVDSNGDGQAGAFDTLRYTVVIVNGGTGDATAVVFTDTPGTHSTLLAGSVTTTQGTVTSGNSNASDTTVSVDLGTLAAGASATVVFDVNVDAPLPSGADQIANQGTVSGGNFASLATDDPATAAVDDPTVTPLANAPVLAATKTVALADDANGDGEPDRGDTLAYTIVVSNTGVGDAAGVQVSDTLDPNALLVVGSVTTAQGTVSSGNTAGDENVLVAVGTLAAGASATVRFDALIDPAAPDTVQQISNQATVSASNAASTGTDDPSTGAAGDPTVIALGQPQPPALPQAAVIPALDRLAALLLLLGVGLLGAFGLRRAQG